MTTPMTEPDETPHWTEYHEPDCPVVSVGRQLERLAARFPESSVGGAFNRLLDTCFTSNSASGPDHEIWCVHCRRGQTTTKETPLVIVEVSGGVAEVTKKPKGVEVHIVDHDNEQAGDGDYTQVESADTEFDYFCDDTTDEPTPPQTETTPSRDPLP